MTYSPNIPQGNDPLDESYVDIQNNFQALDSTFGVDHVTYSNVTPQKGYHSSIHMNPVSTTVTNPPTNYPPTQPATVAGYGQLWSDSETDGSGTDNALYFLTGGGKNIKLTTNFLPGRGAGAEKKGATFLPGGFIVNFGQFSSASSTSGGPITFRQAFPNECLGIQMTCSEVAAGGDPATFSPGSITTSQFSWTANRTLTKQVYWIAYGY